MTELPQGLRKEIALSINQPLFKRLNFFAGFPEGVIASIASHMAPLQVPPSCCCRPQSAMSADFLPLLASALLPSWVQRAGLCSQDLEPSEYLVHPHLMLVGYHHHVTSSCRRTDRIWVALRRVTAATSEEARCIIRAGIPLQWCHLCP